MRLPSFWNINFITTAIHIVLTTARSRLNYLTCTIIISIRAIISCSCPITSCIRVIIPFCWKVIIISTVAISLIMTTNIGPITLCIPLLISYRIVSRSVCSITIRSRMVSCSIAITIAIFFIFFVLKINCEISWCLMLFWIL